MYKVAPDTDIKENEIFLLYEDIQMGSGAKTYMKKFLPPTSGLYLIMFFGQ
jgi:hypothetical protein